MQNTTSLQKNNSGHHLALYLGEKLLLSKLGGLPIVISNLEQLYEIYKPDSITKITEKTD